MTTSTLRLTKLQTETLIPALRQIYINHKNLQLTGHLRDCHPDIFLSGGSRQFGSNNPALMEVILQLWGQVQKLRTSGGRIYGIDVFGLAACIFLVRVTMQKVRHGHHEAWALRLDRSANQFIAKLEALRKRLKRSTIAEIGTEKYHQVMRHWRSFLRFLRYHHLYCRCSYRPRNNRYRLSRMVLDQFCLWTEEELKRRGKAAPANLRELIRRHLAYGRRGRTTYIVVHPRSERSFAAPHLADYVLSRIHQEK
jgi:hypothetical protein